MVVFMICIQCGHESRFPPPFAHINLSCLQCATPCQSWASVGCYIDQDPPLVFLPQWKDWTIKLLVRKVCRSKWLLALCLSRSWILTVSKSSAMRILTVSKDIWRVSDMFLNLLWSSGSVVRQCKLWWDLTGGVGESWNYCSSEPIGTSWRRWKWHNSFGIIGKPRPFFSNNAGLTLSPRIRSNQLQVLSCCTLACFPIFFRS